ncbi:TlpA family protein disulfide reductase [Pseudorhodoferax sp.]|uniref:TlpA family protein disulfide reductase n=1 Tax=Pseudorhodoferax sp. TaxID=1993553 RepID=UPI0039E34B41
MSAAQRPEGARPAGRRAWLAAAGGIALAAGAGVAWWTRRPPAASAAAAQPLWSLQSTQPDGTPLAMAGFRGRPLLANFWAPWCPPCVEEMPLIDAFFREHRANGWQVVGLAVDRPAGVQAFLARTPVAFPVGILGMAGLSAVRALGNDAGALPFSLVLDGRGNVHERKMGQITPEDLRRWTVQIRAA